MKKSCSPCSPVACRVRKEWWRMDTRSFLEIWCERREPWLPASGVHTPADKDVHLLLRLLRRLRRDADLRMHGRGLSQAPRCKSRPSCRCRSRRSPASLSRHEAGKAIVKYCANAATCLHHGDVCHDWPYWFDQQNSPWLATSGPPNEQLPQHPLSGSVCHGRHV